MALEYATKANNKEISSIAYSKPLLIKIRNGKGRGGEIVKSTHEVELALINVQSFLHIHTLY